MKRVIISSISGDEWARSKMEERRKAWRDADTDEFRDIFKMLDAEWKEYREENSNLTFAEACKTFKASNELKSFSISNGYKLVRKVRTTSIPYDIVKIH